MWHWFGGRQVMYCPQSYWQPGTRLTVRSALAGHPIGNRFGDVDRSATATIGNSVKIEVDNATKQMDVFVDGVLARTLPVSLGKPSTPSSSGHMVIMDEQEHTIFDTTRTATNPDDRYRIPSTTRSASPGAASSCTPHPGRSVTRADATCRTVASMSR